jgi:hypothetical protein
MSAFGGKADITRKKRISVGASCQRGASCTLVSAVSQNTVFLWRSKCSGADMNSSLYTADRTTHLKIVVVGLAAAIMIAVIGISARELNLGTDIMTAQTPTVIKAGGPVVFTDRSGPVIR